MDGLLMTGALRAQGAAHYWMELPPKEYTDVIDVSVARIDF